MKAILIVPKNFLDFRSDTIEKQGIINSSSSDGYASVVLSDSKVAFQEEMKKTTFRLFIFCVCFINCVA